MRKSSVTNIARLHCAPAVRSQQQNRHSHTLHTHTLKCITHFDCRLAGRTVAAQGMRTV